MSEEELAKIVSLTPLFKTLREIKESLQSLSQMPGTEDGGYTFVHLDLMLNLGQWAEGETLQAKVRQLSMCMNFGLFGFSSLRGNEMSKMHFLVLSFSNLSVDFKDNTYF